MKLRILLAEDHYLFRTALRSLLESDPTIEVVAEASDGLEVLARAGEALPDVVCMDVNMPGLNGIEATRRLLATLPTVKVIGLSAYADKHFIQEMFDAGAAGYVTKGEAGEKLLPVIHSLCQEALAPGGGAPAAGNAPPLAPMLGSREKEVLQLLAAGCTTAQVAERLQLAPATVEVHCRNMMRKLDLHSIAELARYAVQSGNAS